MTLLLGLPMFIVAGTAALAIAVSSITSIPLIANSMRLGIALDILLFLLLLAGTAAGAWVGPRLSRHLHERWLLGILCMMLSLIGLRYLNL